MSSRAHVFSNFRIQNPNASNKHRKEEFFFEIFAERYTSKKMLCSWHFEKYKNTGISVFHSKLLNLLKFFLSTLIIFSFSSQDETYDLRVLNATELRVNPFAIHVPEGKIRYPDVEKSEVADFGVQKVKAFFKFQQKDIFLILVSVVSCFAIQKRIFFF